MDDLFDDFGFTNAHRDEDEYQPEVQDDEEPQQSLNTAFSMIVFPFMDLLLYLFI